MLLSGSTETNSFNDATTHAQEQENLKDAFKNALTEQEDDEEFFTKRAKSNNDAEQEEIDYRNFLLENLASDGI